MKRHFNKAAFHILSDDREAAKRALLVYFNENSDGLEDFVNSFVDWGISIIKMSFAIKNGNEQ